MSVNKEELILQAKCAEQEDRFDDMASTMKTLTEQGVELTIEERNLLSAAYKNAIETRRSFWNLISSIEEKTESLDPIQQVAKEHRDKVEKEITDVCKEIVGLLDSHLIPKATNSESKIFYLKMKGDYYRYLAEVSTGDARKSVVEDSQKTYEDAFEIAKMELAPAHPTRLSLALNFSVFFYEILKMHDIACQIAQQALEDANKMLETLNEASNDSTSVMELLQENILLWKNRTDETAEQQEPSEN